MSLNSNFIEAVKRLYPTANFVNDVVIQDNADGKGPFLAAWNLPGSPPTDAEIATSMATLPASASILKTSIFLSRLSDAEYVALRQAATTRLAAGNGTLARWLETSLANGINLNDPKTIAVKTNAVTAGLLTQTRADAIFAL